MKEKVSKRQKETKKDRSNKFCYSSGDIKFIKSKKSVKESYSSFAEFLFEKEEVPFNDKTMRWITIKDERDRNQHILIKKKDGTVLAGMGGEHNGEKLKDVFKELGDKRDEIEQDKENYEEFLKQSYQTEIEEFRKNAFNGFDYHEEYTLKHDGEMLKNDEDWAIEEYTKTAYRNINGILRNFDYWKESKLQDIIENDLDYLDPEEDDIEAEAEDMLNHIIDESEEQSKTISTCLKRNRTKKPIITYRGLAPDVVQMIEDNMEVGKVLYDEGFVSSSTEKTVAKGFSGWGNGYIMEIHIPKGSKAASVKGISDVPTEYEVLIDKGSSFLIKQIDHENKTLVVELRQN